MYRSWEDMQSPPGCTSNFLHILMAFSVVNIFFAIYLQCQVWREIMSEENISKFIDGDNPCTTYSGALGQSAMFTKAVTPAKESLAVPCHAEKVVGYSGKIIIPRTVVQSSFKKVFMEDFGVLFMFLLLLGIFFVSWQGHHYVETRGPSSCSISVMTEYCGFLFFWIGFLWSGMYMCCSCCSSKVSIAKPADTRGYESVLP